MGGKKVGQNSIHDWDLLEKLYELIKLYVTLTIKKTVICTQKTCFSQS